MPCWSKSFGRSIHPKYLGAENKGHPRDIAPEPFDVHSSSCTPPNGHTNVGQGNLDGLSRHNHATGNGMFWILPNSFQHLLPLLEILSFVTIFTAKNARIHILVGQMHALNCSMKFMNFVLIVLIVKICWLMFSNHETSQQIFAKEFRLCTRHWIFYSSWDFARHDAAENIRIIPILTRPLSLCNILMDVS